jgi:hypothetical protein
MVDASDRMASPSHDYGTHTNSRSALVYLTRIGDYRLAEGHRRSMR